MSVVIVIMLGIIIILLLEINSKLPKKDPGKEALARDMQLRQSGEDYPSSEV
ncbi:hypothetical protein [Paenibacillus sp. OV219]|uniref:hypothetical protein n=1 Tax=Paenibacillus sp. OV219 TaxID=1884377 RepID=UPI0008CA264A|nr:hypothetical protein [Paenibacillus sp. OV219]SEM70989.1 hypothetical protein SAMN05518847_101580 [Paenibacillus sp. OV219]